MKKLLTIGLFIFALIYLNNASWLAGKPDGQLALLAHRGVHQTYSKDRISDETCTAAIIDAPEHSLLENTLDSIEAAFLYGAAVVEFDIHPTIDGRFAVFHDWTLDCRTNGSGVTREHSLEHLQSLDIGYGYTADGGDSFPFRGKAIGKMPSLSEVLDTFPENRFLINIKSNDGNEGKLLADFLSKRLTETNPQFMVYGGDLPISSFKSLMPNIPAFSKKTVKNCILNYAYWGWLSVIPNECKDTVLLIPEQYAKYLWGWPRRFVGRMETNNTLVILTGWEGGRTDGIDNPEEVRNLSEGFSGLIWTDKIERVGSGSSDR